jgi:hypothetical protein
MNRGMVFIIASLVFAIIAFGLLVAGQANMVPQLKPITQAMLQPSTELVGPAEGGRMYPILLGVAIVYGAVAGAIMAMIFGTKE